MRLAVLVAGLAIALGACTPGRDGPSLARCTTACDCAPGYDCADGRCLSGTMAMFCCDACPPSAPPQQACVYRDGLRSTCADARAPRRKP